MSDFIIRKKDLKNLKRKLMKKFKGHWYIWILY